MGDDASSGSREPLPRPDAADGTERTDHPGDPAGPDARNGALRDDAERIGAILSSASDDAIIALNLGGRVTHWNTGAEHVTGYAASEMLGRSAALIFTPEDRAAGVFVGELCAALDHGRAPNERWHLRKDGSRFWASGSMLPLLDAEGRVRGFLNTFRDRTEARLDVERRDRMLGEMRQRMGNTLAGVRSVVAQAACQVAQPEEFLTAIDACLAALALPVAPS